MGCCWSAFEDISDCSSETKIMVVDQPVGIEMTTRSKVENWLSNTGVTFTIEGKPSGYSKINREI